MTQLISARGVHATGGAAARIFAVATAAVAVVSLLGLSAPPCAEATSAPAMTQTRTVTWLSTDEQPDFVEAFEQDGLTYSLAGTEIVQLESQFGTVPAQRSVTVPCEPADLDAARNSFAPSLDVQSRSPPSLRSIIPKPKMTWPFAWRRCRGLSMRAMRTGSRHRTRPTRCTVAPIPHRRLTTTT